MSTDSALARSSVSEPSAGDVLAVLRGAFGIDGRLTRLHGEVDFNWRLDGDGGVYIVKASRESEDAGVLQFREAMLTHIHRVDPGLRVPVPVASLEGGATAPMTAGGEQWRLRVLGFVPGRSLRHAGRSPAVLESLGRFMGRLTGALQGFGHPGSHRGDYLWNLDGAGSCRGLVEHIEPAETRDLARRVLDRWHARVEPVLSSLPAAVVHHDANDDNVLVDGRDGDIEIGLVDFGDAVFARRINELAVTLAYALMDVTDTTGAARSVIRGYTTAFPLTSGELSVVFDLAAARLAMSLCISARRRHEAPDNVYLQVSQRQAAALLEKLDAMNPDFLACLARAAGGHPPVATANAVVEWLSARDGAFGSPFPFDLNTAPRMVVRLGENAPGTEHAGDPAAYDRWLQARMRESGARYAIGLYDERRDCYTTGQFESANGCQRRSVHLGMDLFVPAGTAVQAPLAGRVLSVADNDVPLDYGPTVIVEHRCGADGPPFWTLYGHLSRERMNAVAPGDEVEAGQVIGAVGTPEENGGWTPHLHFQVITDLLGETGNFHGAGEPDNMDVWKAICPDPNLILGLAPETFQAPPAPPSDLEAARKSLLGPSMSLSYRHKLEIVRGHGAWLYDHTGRAYLDCVNNISHVGHCHPRVVEALSAQAAVLNTNTRYLHPNIVEYAARLLATFPESLSVCFFVCSGSEANELALRLARTHTRRADMVVLDWAYHGNTGALVDLSPYKFKGKGGGSRREHVHVAALPDPYRGPYQGRDESSALAYAASVDECIQACRDRTGAGPAAMIAESISGCGGQVVFPDRYLFHAFERIRKAGGVCIADEVQTGFGRVGDAMWAFELQDAVPDIVTLGKPIGNGHPMAAVVTTREIADAFANGMEYFNSFGGNPVSCAVGMTVMDVIAQEGLRDKARATGACLMERLGELARGHPLIGDVRGRGMFIGIELVGDRETLAPAAGAAEQVVNLLREDGVLLSIDGPHDNVLKFKPPLAFGATETDIFCRKLDRALRAVGSLAPHPDPLPQGEGSGGSGNR